MKKRFFGLFIVLALVSLLQFDVLQVCAQTPGVIVTVSSDTTWTKASSPHELTGPLLVKQGVTLTIDAGAVVNLIGYELRIEGTLIARGSTTDSIRFNGGGKLNFTPSSSDCIIEYAVLEKVTVYSSSYLKINNCELQDVKIEDASLTISDCNIEGEVSVVDSYIVRNIFTNTSITAESTEISDNTINGGDPEYGWFMSMVSSNPTLSVSGSSIITNNRITSHSMAIGIFIKSGHATVSGNVISNSSKGISISADATIEGNLLVGNAFGVMVGRGSVTIRNNTIVDGSTGIMCSLGKLVTIEGNLFTNQNGFAIDIETQAIIRNNTILHNSGCAIRMYNCPPTSINYNNIEGYQQYAIFSLGNPEHDIDATNNWWGTTDSELIDQALHDSKYSFDLTKINFIPFLTEPNPQAMPDENLDFSSPTIPEFSSLIILPFVLVVLLGAMICKHKIQKRIFKGSHFCAAY